MPGIYRKELSRVEAEPISRQPTDNFNRGGDLRNTFWQQLRL